MILSGNRGIISPFNVLNKLWSVVLKRLTQPQPVTLICCRVPGGRLCFDPHSAVTSPRAENRSPRGLDPAGAQQYTSPWVQITAHTCDVSYRIWKRFLVFVKAGISTMFVYCQHLMNPERWFPSLCDEWLNCAEELWWQSHIVVECWLFQDPALCLFRYQALPLDPQ